MIYRTSQNWNLWGSAHPSACGCIAEGWPQCTCKYHIVKNDDSQIFSFDDWQEADAKFVQLTGEKILNDLIIKKL